MCRSRAGGVCFHWLGLILLSLSSIAAGCGSPGRGGVEVAGVVTVDGRPLEKGSVVFVPDTGTTGHKAAAPVLNGEFSIDETEGPVPGDYKVEVYADQKLSVPLDDPLAYAEHAPPVPPPNLIAAKYNQHTVLTAVVTSDGENVFEFAVESVSRR